jgi:hypothetical protein
MARMMAAAVVAAFVAAFVWFVSAASGQAFPTEMVGAWRGDAQIFVNWTAQRTLPVRITIGADGSVTGTIGDATLRSGRFEANRNSIERALNIKTDWIVVGALEGDVIKAEGIHRDSVKVPLDWIDGHFEGGVNTSGSHFGGKQSMWLAAGHLRLERSSAHY